jgi:uncharacterized protein (TIGR02117 family)
MIILNIDDFIDILKVLQKVSFCYNIFMKIIKYLIKTLLFLTSIVAIYFLVAYILTFFPTKNVCKKEEVTIYLYSTDIGLLSHTELIIKTDLFKKEDLALFDAQIGSNRLGYLAFSYGDLDFMMDTKGFDDLDFKLAFNGLFINTPALIKVGHYGDFYKEQTKEIKLSLKCLKKLQRSIINSFKRDENGSLIIYDDKIKDPSFFYYRAKRDYNLFHTCNSWMGDRLRDGGLGVSYWTPFASDIKID